jgi:hypothetical protein
MVQRFLLEKNALAPVTSHRWLVHLPPFSPSEFEGKKASNYAADAAAQSFRCRQSKHTVLRDTSPRGNSALIEDFGSISCRCIRRWRRAITTLPPREGKHDGGEVLAAHHDSAAAYLARAACAAPSNCAPAPERALRAFLRCCLTMTIIAFLP